MDRRSNDTQNSEEKRSTHRASINSISKGAISAYHVNTSQTPWPWSAPEVTLKQRYTMAADVYMIGVPMWEVQNKGADPYNWKEHARDPFSIIKNIAEEKVCLKWGQNIPSVVAKLGRICLAADPEIRPDSSQLQTWIDKMLKKARNDTNQTSQAQERAAACAAAIAAMKLAASATASKSSKSRPQGSTSRDSKSREGSVSSLPEERKSGNFADSKNSTTRGGKDMVTPKHSNVATGESSVSRHDPNVESRRPKRCRRLSIGSPRLTLRLTSPQRIKLQERACCGEILGTLLRTMGEFWAT